MDEKATQGNAVSRETTAVLEHISGPDRGLDIRLLSDQITLYVGDDRRLRANTTNIPENRTAVARLTRSDGTYLLESEPGQKIWVNGRQFDAGLLLNKDVVEFGESGPLSRFRLGEPYSHSRRRPGEICADCWDYVRSSRKPMSRRLAFAAGDGLRQLLTRTTLVFRLGVVALFAIISLAVYQQYSLNILQQKQLADAQLKAEQIAHALMESRQIAAADLESLQQMIAGQLAQRDDRLQQLERSASATIDAIKRASPSVVFLQGAYGLRDPDSGRELRHAANADGKILLGPGGQPLLTFDGSGPTLERLFTGTGFAVSDGTLLATNRHVAVPWTASGQTLAFGDKTLQPFMIQLLAYVPGEPDAIQVEFAMASDDADLALVRMADPSRALSPLAISDEEPEQGAAVSVLGYPTGLNSMVASAGQAFLDALRDSGKSGFWDVSARLAEEGRIKPLSSFGIVAKRTDQFLVYDAATTSGGSGGPVINNRGEVVAVNTAVLQQYNGSNFGVLASKLVNLIELAKRQAADANQG